MAVLAVLLGGAAGAYAWASGSPAFSGPGGLAWSDLLPQIPVRRRAWLMVPAGVLAMVFTARRSRRGMASY